jgi:chorismate-pyruvate lyase
MIAFSRLAADQHRPQHRARDQLGHLVRASPRWERGSRACVLGDEDRQVARDPARHRSGSSRWRALALSTRAKARRVRRRSSCAGSSCGSHFGPRRRPCLGARVAARRAA